MYEWMRAVSERIGECSILAEYSATEQERDQWLAEVLDLAELLTGAGDFLLTGRS